MAKKQFLVSSRETMGTVIADLSEMLKTIPEIKVEMWAARKTGQSQRNLYWMWMGELCAHIQKLTGQEYTKEEMSYRLKCDFGFTYDKRIGKKEYNDIPKSTKIAEKGELFFFMEQVDAYASNDLRCYLTKPSDSEFIKLRESQHDT